MYNTSAFAQNLQKVTRIHQRCSLGCSKFIWRWCSFGCNASCLHICLHILHMLFIAFIHPGSRRRIVLFSINTLLTASYWNIVVHGISIQWRAMGPLDDWSCAALLCCGKQGANWENWNWCNVFSTAFSQARCSCSLRGCRQESRAHGVVGNITAFQLERPRQCQRPQRPELSLRSLGRQKPRKPGFAWHSPWLLVMVLRFVSLGGLERLVRYLSSEAHFNLQTCIWNILECCSFRSLTWSCWGFPVNQSASEFPVRSLDCKIVHDLQNWKEAEHCFWMKGEIGCTWWSALLSALHIENITTRKRFWRGPSISTQMTLIATQSNNWSIYRVYALCFWCLWCEDFSFFSP